MYGIIDIWILSSLNTELRLKVFAKSEVSTNVLLALGYMIYELLVTICVLKDQARTYSLRLCVAVASCKVDLAFLVPSLKHGCLESTHLILLLP